MTWQELKQSASPVSAGGTGDPAISGIGRDSRAVKPGWVYVSIPGQKCDGDSFIPDALERGASAVVSENAHENLDVPWIQVNNSRAALGTLARRIYGAGIDRVKMVAVTGTNGKTTIAHLLHGLFAKLYGSESAWMFGTVEYVLGTTTIPAPNTTPESSDILRHMAEATVRPEAVCMEVSSHALALDRATGLNFDVALFTNLTQDHLDFHSDMESYYQAKKKLFTEHLRRGAVAVINIDDDYGRRLAGELINCDMVTVGTSEDASFRIDSAEAHWSGVRMSVTTGDQSLDFHAGLAGTFNVQNVALMAAAALAMNIDIADIQNALAAIKTVPGRMERVRTELAFDTVVDYAHTPDALVNVSRRRET